MFYDQILTSVIIFSELTYLCCNAYPLLNRNHSVSCPIVLDLDGSSLLLDDCIIQFNLQHLVKNVYFITILVAYWSLLSNINSKSMSSLLQILHDRYKYIYWLIVYFPDPDNRDRTIFNAYF